MPYDQDWAAAADILRKKHGHYQQYWNIIGDSTYDVATDTLVGKVGTYIHRYIGSYLPQSMD